MDPLGNHQDNTTTDKAFMMQQPIVIKQGNPTGQVGLQPAIVSVAMSVNTNLTSTIPGVMTKPTTQIVAAPAQNIGSSSAQTALIPNVQILNMRPTTPAVTTQKSVATVSPRVVIGASQVVSTRAAAPGITLQTLPALQPGQQSHLILKTENGQYQLLRVGPAPTATSMTPQPTQAIRLSTMPTQGNITVTTVPQTQTSAIQNIQTQQIIQQPGVVSVSSPLVSAPNFIQPQTTSQMQQNTKPSENTKEKCRNFLANLLDLSSKEPRAVERNVRSLIQELIDAQVQPEQFCERLERLLKASPQPCLIGFLKRSLPLLRCALVRKELAINCIKPPPVHVAFPSSQPSNIPIVTSAIPVQAKPLVTMTQPTTNIPVSRPVILQNIPVQVQKMVSKNSKVNVTPSIFSKQGTKVTTSTTNSASNVKSIVKEKKTNFTFSDIDKISADDDINDVAAMGGVNLIEESRRILGSTDLIGTQIRSCKDEFTVPPTLMSGRLKYFLNKHRLDENQNEVPMIVSHATQEFMKNAIGQLSIVAEHRNDMVKNDPRYEITQDVKGQLKFIEDLDRVERKKREENEREILMKAAKSRSKSEDPEQAKLKAKAKEMQRAEMEELRQREANLTALQAIGPRKKPKIDANTGPSNSGECGFVSTGMMRNTATLRARVKRVNNRDAIYMMERQRDTTHSVILYKAYMK